MNVTGISEDTPLAREIRDFVREGFTPHFDELGRTFPQNPSWRRLTELGSELWLDTGSLEDAEQLWTREFSALTTNNTLLNREVQKGTYDDLVRGAADMLAAHGELCDRGRMLEIAFILNARHALRLVERFDARVSVEEHTDLADDLDATVAYAIRYHAICPERFIVKIPFTAAGLLATRRVSAAGVPVNHTLGFSARQNYVIARIGRPAYVNVFMGRLNAFVGDNKLGSGDYVGERATLASQAVLRELRESHNVPSRQIGASFREGKQVRDLAGIDVMTIPPRVAREFLDLAVPVTDLTDCTGRQYQPPLAEGVQAKAVALQTLWDVDDKLVACMDALDRQDVDRLTADELIEFFASHGCGDLLVRWTDEQIQTSAAEGKIPKLDNWSDLLSSGSIGLDSLMNLAGLCSFRTDQKAMDDRVAGVLQSA